MRRVASPWVIVSALAVTFSVTAASLGDDHDESKNEPLPQRQFRVTVADVVNDSETIVKRVAIETHQNSRVQVTSDRPGGGGLSYRTDSSGANKPPAPFHMVILGDRVRWKPGGVDALKFYMSLQGAAMSNTGPMPEGTELGDVLKVSLKSGVYRYASPVPVLRLKDHSYRLVVTHVSPSE